MNMATPLSTGSWPDFRQKVRKNFGQNFEFFAFPVKYRRFATIKWHWYTENAKKKRFWLIFRGSKFENFWKFRHRYTKMLPSGKFWFSKSKDSRLEYRFIWPWRPRQVSDEMTFEVLPFLNFQTRKQIFDQPTDQLLWAFQSADIDIYQLAIRRMFIKPNI